MPKLFAYVFIESNKLQEIYTSFIIPPPENDHGKSGKSIILVGFKLPKLVKVSYRTLVKDKKRLPHICINVI